jgi:hypothetical protein
MAFIGGDVLEVACTHPTLGSFRFSPKAAEAFNLEKGGIRNTDDNTGVTGQGQSIWIKNRNRWNADGPVAVDMVSDNEMLNLDALAASPVEGTWTFTMIGGAIYKGTGNVVGELKVDTNTASMPLKIQGSGQLELIS